MAQTHPFTDESFVNTHDVQTDMANIENNLKALKNTFAGTTPPLNIVEGQWWYDTSTYNASTNQTGETLKLRNKGSTAWQTVWNMKENKPFVTNLVTADFGAAIKDAAAGTPSLRTIGNTALSACAGNDARLSDARVANGGNAAHAETADSSTTTSNVDGYYFNWRQTQAYPLIHALDIYVPGYGWITLVPEIFG